MAKFNGDALKIEVGGVTVGLLTNVELTCATNMFDVTTKDSGGKREILPGNSEWSMTADGIIDFQITGSWDAADYFAAWNAKTELALTMTNGVTGDKQFDGDAYIDNVTMTGPQGDKTTFTVSFQGTGALAITTIV